MLLRLAAASRRPNAEVRAFIARRFWLSITAPPARGRNGGEPIAFDIIVVCQATGFCGGYDAGCYRPRPARPSTISAALDSARSKIACLLSASFALSRNDRKIILYDQLLTTLATARGAADFARARVRRDEFAR
jgi:hypothetical protein